VGERRVEQVAPAGLQAPVAIHSETLMSSAAKTLCR
jgi:hypothetical protein